MIYRANDQKKYQLDVTVCQNLLGFSSDLKAACRRTIRWRQNTDKQVEAPEFELEEPMHLVGG